MTYIIDAIEAHRGKHSALVVTGRTQGDCSMMISRDQYMNDYKLPKKLRMYWHPEYYYVNVYDGDGIISFTDTARTRDECLEDIDTADYLHTIFVMDGKAEVLNLYNEAIEWAQEVRDEVALDQRHEDLMISRRE